jgi:hypothetical protein
MKLAHLGDTLDAWKGWVIAAIRDETPRLRVIPMLTDQTHWGYDHFVRYAAMLGVPDSAILLRFTAFPPGMAAGPQFFHPAGRSRPTVTCGGGRVSRLSDRCLIPVSAATVTHPRVGYFEEALRRIEPGDDVFLDPDTGIKRVKGQRVRNAHPEHVTTHELSLLPPARGERRSPPWSEACPASSRSTCPAATPSLSAAAALGLPSSAAHPNG